MDEQIGVVVVNFRTPDLTIDCLKSLNAIRSECGTLSVIVVDNASGDDSVRRLDAAVHQEGWSDWVTLLSADRNGGFAYGNNFAIRHWKTTRRLAEFAGIWLLNSDTVVRAGALKELLRAMDKHPQAGFFGSRLEGTDGSVQPFAFRFPSLFREFAFGLSLDALFWLFPWLRVVRNNPLETETVDWVSGASLMIRPPTLDEVGLLDEGYFLYFEEVDLMRRGRDRGWTSVAVPASRVIHLGGMSTGVDESSHGRRPAYWFASRGRYLTKNLGRFSRVLSDVGWLVGHLLLRMRMLFGFSRRELNEKLLSDFVRYNFFRRV